MNLLGLLLGDVSYGRGDADTEGEESSLFAGVTSLWVELGD